MEFNQELNKVQHKVINAAIIGSMILVLPAVASSVVRYFEIGWHNIYWVHLLSGVVGFLLFIYRKGLSLFIKVNFYCTLMLFQSFAGLLSFRMVGLSSLYILAAGLPTLIFGRKQGIYYSLFYLIGYAVIAYLNLNGFVGNSIDYNSYTNNVSTWLSVWIGGAFSLIIIVYSISEFYRLFSKNLVKTIENTVELEKSLEKIKFQEERFSHFMDAYPYPVTIKDTNLKYIYGNKAVLNLIKKANSSLIGQVQEDIYPEELSRDLAKSDTEVLANNQLVRKLLTGELNGRMLYYELIKFPLKDHDGNQLIGSITIDRTEQKNAEFKLIESEETFRTVFTKAADGVSLIYEEKFVDCNQAVAEHLGYESASEMIGKTPWDVSPEFQPDGKKSKEKAMEMINQCITKGYHSFDWVHLSKNGENIYYNIMLTPIEINNKQYIYCVWRNVTDKHQTQKALLESEEKYRSIFEGSFDGFVFINGDQKIIECNRSFFELLGFEKNELLKLSFDDITPEKWSETKQSYLNSTRILEKGNSGVFEMEFLNAEKQLVPVELNIHELTILDKRFYWAVVRDVSDRKRMEKENFSIMVSSEEKERARYAKELHDGLGPILSTSMIYLHTMRRETDKKKLNDYIDRTYGLIEDAVVSIREISNNLSPEVLTRYGLVHAVRSFIEKLKQVSDIEFVIRTNLDARLTEIVEFTLYRTIIELINNSIKYAEATRILIEINKQEEFLNVVFNDNGNGYDYATSRENSRGFGLMNLEKRIVKIDGRFNYQSSPGNGVFVDIRINIGSL